MKKGQGSKYDPKLDAKTIASLMRAEIKEAVKTNRLPKGKYSVRLHRFAGGRSIDIRVNELEFPVYEATVNPDSGVRSKLTKIGQLTYDFLTELHNSYNYDNSDSQVDYFDVNYYGSASFGYLRESAWAKPDPVAEQMADFNYVGSPHHY